MAARAPVTYAVLALLLEGPGHAYGVHRQLVDRGMDRLVNVERRNSVQQVLERLQREGLVEVTSDTDRRITYAANEAGRAEFLAWVRDTLARPVAEHPRLPVAVSVMAFLPPEEVGSLLRERRAELDRGLADLAALPAPDLPRVLVLEVELQLATMRAERDWVSGVLAELDEGTLTWSPEELLRTAAGTAR